MKTNCILWPGAKTGNGRGAIQIEGKMWAVHRLALMLKIGRHIATGKQANHTCDNPLCVNPDHLYEGAQADNRADCISRDRANAPKGAAHWNHKHSPDKIKKIKQLLKDGRGTTEIARMVNLTPQYINKIKRGEVWSWLD